MSTHAATEAPVKQTPAHQKLPPGPRIPRFLQTIAFILAGPRFLEACRRRYGGAVTLGTLFDDKFVMLFDPALVKELFQGPHDQLHAGEANALLGPVVGQRSVLLLDGAEHLRHRRLMLPHLHGHRMQGHAQTITDAADREIDGWPVGEPFPLMPLLGRLGSDRRAAAQRFEAQRRAVDEILYDEIAHRRAEPDLAKRDDVFSALLLAEDEDGNRLSDAEVRDELVTLLLAGHETTATGLAWTFDLLLHNPGVLARARTGGNDYLDAVVKESLRVRPVIPGVGRVVRGEPFELGPWRIPAGVEINPSIRVLHRRRDLFPDPGSFRPERFLADDAPDTYTWIPFGGGTRRCLGASFALLEMRIVVQRVLARAPLRAADSELEEVEFRGITLAPRRGVRAVLAQTPAP